MARTLAFALIALTFASAAPAALAQAGQYTIANGVFRIPLTVKDNQSVERKGWPISCGVPMPVGLVKEVSALRLLNDKGIEVPCQFGALSRHWGRDGSLRWVLLDFQADMPANGQAKFVLTNDRPAAAIAGPINVAESADAITVTNGALKVAISKKRATLFESVSVGGAELVKASDHDGPRATAEKQSFERYTGGEWNLHGWEPRHSDGQKPIKEGDYYSDVSPPDEAAVERVGPMHVIVRVRGTYRSPDKGEDVLEHGVYNFTYRVHFYRGKDFVRVEHTVENSRYAQPEFQAKLLDHSLWTTVTLGGAKCAIGTASGKTGEEALNGKPFATFKRDAKQTKWIELTSATGRVGVAAPLAGEEWSFDVDGARLAVRPYSIHFGRENPLEKMAPKSWGRGGFSLDFGSRKTYDIYYRFAKGTGTDLAALVKGGVWPLFAFAPPKWYADSGVWNMDLADGYARPGRPAGQLDPAGAEAAAMRKKWDFNSGGHHASLSSIYDNSLMLADLNEFQRNYWKSSHAIDFYQWNYRGYEPTLDPALLAKAHRQVLFGPKDFYMYGARGQNPGTHYNGYKYLPDFEHYGFMHLFEHYYLWGDRRAIESITGFVNFSNTFEWDAMFKREGEKSIPPLEQVDFFDKHHDSLRRSHYARIYSWQLYTHVQGYQATGNAVLDLMTKWQLRRMSHLQRLSRGMPDAWISGLWDSNTQQRWKSIPYPDPNDVTTFQFKNQSWQYGKTMLGFHEAYKTYGAEEILDNIWGVADYFRQMPKSTNGKTLPNDPYIPATLNEAPLQARNHARTAQGVALAWYYTGADDMKQQFEAQAAVTREVQTGTWGHLAAWVRQRKAGKDRRPEAIADLKCETAGRDGLTFTWTAPKAYGSSGKAARYFLKMSDKPIVEYAPVNNPDAPKDPWIDRSKRLAKPECWHPDFLKKDAFWMATHVEGEPTPSSAGSKETCTVTVVRPHNYFGLPLEKMPKIKDLPAGTYYFAVCSYDEDNNLSPLSNVVLIELK